MNQFFYKPVLLVFIAVFFSVTAGSALADYIAGEEANQKGDRKTAFKEFYAAAQEGDRRAYGKLGSMYLYGLGTVKDHHQAYIWFHMAYLSGERAGERFRDAASSTMTHEQYEKAVESAEEQRIKQKLGKSPPQSQPPVPPRLPSS